jgi:hypothetical protein
LKKKLKILVISTYPIIYPKHGGQKRVDAIVKEYRKKFLEVRHCSVFFKGFYSEYEAYDIALGSKGERLVMQSPLTGDIVSGEAIYSDPVVKSKITRILTEFGPDVIHIEQPFPYLGLKPLLFELKLKPKIVFGSQNIEAPMKRDILKNAGVDATSITEIESIINQLEKDLSKDSDLVIACTQEDLATHKRFGAKKTVLAKNGAKNSYTDNQSLSHWQGYYKKSSIERTVLFVGSAHPPNWNGFIDMVGKGLGFIPADTRIVIAGSISDFFKREINENSIDIEDATFWLRAFSAGRLSEVSLGGLIKLSDVIILPITEGGGSNLKTAEAILANKKVVTTTHGLRSFEWFKDFPNVWIADNKNSFQKSISEALNTPFKSRSTYQIAQAKQVLWEECLSGMVEGVSKL